MVLTMGRITRITKTILPRNVVKNFNKPFHMLRIFSANERELPNFIIIGSQRCGTTSLYNYLKQHPQIITPLLQEVHYFDGGLNPKVDVYAKGPKWYRACFPLKNSMAENQITFEGSPLYIHHPLSAERMHKLVPDVKIIALLRNPTDRAISHYYHQYSHGTESLSIMEAFRIEEERLKPVLQAGDYKNRTFIDHSYKMRGLYSMQLIKYYELFPTENIKIINSENLFEDPSGTLKDIYRFLGINENSPSKNLQPKNVNKFREEVEKSVCDYLNEYFEPYNKELYSLIGEDYHW